VGCFESEQRNEFEHLNFDICTERMESGRYFVKNGYLLLEGGGVIFLVGTAARISDSKCQSQSLIEHVSTGLQNTYLLAFKYWVIQNDCPGFNNLSYTIHFR